MRRGLDLLMSQAGRDLVCQRCQPAEISRVFSTNHWAQDMPAWEALQDLTAQLSAATTVEDIGNTLLSVSRRYGLSNVLIVDVTKLFDRVGPAIVYASENLDVIEAFDAKRPLTRGVVLQRAQSSERPFLMSELRRAMEPAEVTGWWYSLPEGKQHKDALVVPVHVDGELFWVGGFSGLEPDLSQPVQAVLSTAIHASYLRFRELLDSRSENSPLSPRESECLRWVADGKTDFEVGKILSISPRTVRFHISNAKAKLGVATRIQAVAKRVRGAPWPRTL
jgi:DNA-binding CsgD family transcriptional regulator